MKAIITLLFTLLITGVYAQNQPVCTKGKDVLTPEKQFQADIKNNDLKVYTVGGLKPSNHKVDTAFQETYGLSYHDFGCIAPPDMDYYTAYNLFVFQYLKEKWANAWEKDIKDNAMGFYEWKEAK